MVIMIIFKMGHLMVVGCVAESLAHDNLEENTKFQPNLKLLSKKSEKHQRQLPSILFFMIKNREKVHRRFSEFLHCFFITRNAQDTFKEN